MDTDRLLDLTFILREHIPPWLLPPKNSFDARRLQTLATHNIRRRIELNSPHDVLPFDDFLKTAHDWLAVITDGRMVLTGGDLRQYLAYGLIVPKYRVYPRMRALVTARSLMFTSEGNLQKITFPQDKAHPGLRPYRARGEVTDAPAAVSPEARDYARDTTLFTFPQITEVAGIRLRLQQTVNLLTMTAEGYRQLRDSMLAALRASAKKTGKPKFCENPDCPSVVPLGHQRYCSRKCRMAAHNAKKPKSTARVEKSYQRRTPLSFDFPITPSVLPGPE